jgi:hypothetical protein
LYDGRTNVDEKTRLARGGFAHFNAVKKMESEITVLQDSKPIFKGRVFSDNVNFYKVKKVEVEGILAYFNDSIVRPYEFTGDVPE